MGPSLEELIPTLIPLSMERGLSVAPTADVTAILSQENVAVRLIVDCLLI